MAQHLARRYNTYFRQAVPAELRSLLGRREIKKSLSRNCEHAVRACKRYAVDAVRF
jgi:cell fate regulator YaaT (PSP1 superfamily)